MEKRILSMAEKKPSLIGAILRKPSMRVQMEASIVGIVGVMMMSLFSAGYMMFSDINLFWKIISGVGEIFILIFMLSNLVTAYIQYYTYKMQMGLYDLDKLDEVEGNKIIESINSIEDNKLIKLEDTKNSLNELKGGK